MMINLALSTVVKPAQCHASPKLSQILGGRMQGHQKVPSTARCSQHFVSSTTPATSAVVAAMPQCHLLTPLPGQAISCAWLRPKSPCTCTTLSCGQAAEERLAFFHTPQGTIIQIRNLKREAWGLPSVSQMVRVKSTLRVSACSLSKNQK